MQDIASGYIFEFGFKAGLASGMAKLHRNKRNISDQWKEKLDYLFSTSWLRKDKNLGIIQKVIESQNENIIDIIKNIHIIGLPVVDPVTGRMVFSKKYTETVGNKLKQTGIYDDTLPEKRDLLLYLNGYYLGSYMTDFYFAYEGCDFIPVIFNMFADDSGYPAGDFHNADVIIEGIGKNDRYNLYVFDLKLFGGGRHLQRMITPEKASKQTIPPPVRGIQFLFSVGNNDILSFTEAVLQTSAKPELTLMDFELKPLSQVLSYTLSYMRYQIDSRKYDTVTSGIIPSTVESAIYTFNTAGIYSDEKKIQKLIDLAERIQGFYQEHRNATHYNTVITQVATSSSDIDILKSRLEYIYAQIKHQRQQYTRLLNEKQKLYGTVRKPKYRWLWDIENADGKTTYNISDLRKSVQERTKEFIDDFLNNSSQSNTYKVLVLAHSTGAGKTTSARKALLSNDHKIVVIYLAPRTQLLHSELEALKHDIKEIMNIECWAEGETIGYKGKVRCVFPYDLEDKDNAGKNKDNNKQIKNRSDSKLIIQRGDKAEEFSEDEKNIGKIKNAVEEILRMVRGSNPPEKIFAFFTPQSITRLYQTTHNTSNHLIKLLSGINDMDYKAVFIIDELLGSDNGLYALEQIVRLVEETSVPATILVFDATAHSKSVFESIWKEYRENGYIAPSFISVPFVRDGTVKLTKNTIAEVYSGYSYPAKRLGVHEYFHSLYSNDNKIPDNPRQWLADTISKIIYNEYSKLTKENKDRKLFVYIQDKNLTGQVKERLATKYGMIGNSVIEVNSVIRDATKELSDDNLPAKIVIATSSLSRGVSLKQKFFHTMVFITNFTSVENNVAEFLQTIARMRGLRGEIKDEDAEKYLKIFYLVPPEDMQVSDEYVNSIVDIISEEKILTDGIPSEDLKAVLRLSIGPVLKELKLLEVTRGVYNYSETLNNAIKSYFNPKKHVIAVVPRQIKPTFIPHKIHPIKDFLTLLRLARGRSEFASDRDIIDQLKGLLESSLRLSFSVSPSQRRQTGRSDVSNTCIPPYFFTPAKVIMQVDPDIKKDIARIFYDLKERLRKLNKDIVTNFENEVLFGTAGKMEFYMPVLVYLPSVAMLEVVDESFNHVDTVVAGYVTKARIETLGRIFQMESGAGHNTYSTMHKVLAIPVENDDALLYMLGRYAMISGELLNAMSEILYGR